MPRPRILEKPVITSVVLDRKLYEAVVEYAYARRMSVSQVMREALQCYLERAESTPAAEQPQPAAEKPPEKATAQAPAT